MRHLGMILPGLAVGLLGVLTGLTGQATTGSTGRAATSAGPPPAETGAPPVYVPVINYQGEDDVCQSQIAVQNVGTGFTKALLVTWPEAGTCPPDCTGALAVECSGLLAPGSSWLFLGAQIPPGAASGLVISANTQRLSEIGVQVDGQDDIVADYLCQKLQRELVTNCWSTTSFLEAYAAGTAFGAIPLELTEGSRLAVTVLRNCPGDITPGVEVAASYAAPSADVLGDVDPDSGGYGYVLPQLYGGSGGEPGSFQSVAYVQNAGPECSEVAVWFQPRDQCTPTIQCAALQIAPGETRAVDIGQCTRELGTGVEGSGVITGTQPLAVAADLIGGDTLSTYSGVSLPTGAADAPLLEVEADTAAYGALLYNPGHGWDSQIHVHNLDRQKQARVKVTFSDRDARPIQSQEEFICPGGSHTFTLPLYRAQRRVRVGSVRVASLPLPADPGATPARLAAVAELIRYGDTERQAVLEAVAYNLVPESAAFVAASTAGGLESGVGLIALPAFPKDLRATGVTAELALTNLVPSRGTTRAAVLHYDQNGLVGLECLALGPGETRYVELWTLPGVTTGFLGSAVVSASYWDHASAEVSNRVGLAASLVLRTGTTTERDVPGDEAAASRGLPLAPAAGEGLSGWQYPPCATPGTPPPTPAPRPTPTPEQGRAAAARRGHVLLPVLNFGSGQVPCEATVEIRNSGPEPAVGVLIQLPWSGFCPPNCAAPVQFDCSGLLAPGESWTLPAAEGSSAGVLLSLTGKTMAQIGAAPGSDELVAQVICNWLAANLTGDCGNYRRLILAYDAGWNLAGVPMESAVGSPLVARVQRRCRRDGAPAGATASYQGLALTALRQPFPTPGRHSYYASLVYGRYDNTDSVFYLQNAGSECASVEVSFRPYGNSEPQYSCSIFHFSPGESIALDTLDCMGPNWRGSAVIASDQPLAVVVEERGVERWSTYPGLAGEDPFDLNFDRQVDLADLHILEQARGSRPGESAWNERADLNHDGAVDEADRQMLIDHLPAGVPTPTPWATLTPAPAGLVYLPFVWQPR